MGRWSEVGKDALKKDDFLARLPAGIPKDSRHVYFVVSDLEVAFAGDFPT